LQEIFVIPIDFFSGGRQLTFVRLKTELLFRFTANDMDL
jgi:hypothetical protein